MVKNIQSHRDRYAKVPLYAFPVADTRLHFFCAGPLVHLLVCNIIELRAFFCIIAPAQASAIVVFCDKQPIKRPKSLYHLLNGG